MTTTRFAPSPTGYLHIGGVRTALFSWLYARQNQGKFILRIEDTDQERSTQESVEAILEGMVWLGLDYDEGPIYQTDRFERYQEIIAQLLETGQAYRCYCSKDRLKKMREQQRANKQKPKYDGCCRYLEKPQDGDYVIRFKNPLEGQVVIDDLVRGQITIDNRELDDLVIARSDGVPTYNLTVVVDDMDMEISHVVRGDDHINNTPRQINILNALGVTIPQYAHLPMILGGDGARLSKRHGAASVLQYKQEGYLPEALLNYLVRLGWSFEDKEIFSVEEMIKLFSLKAVNAAPSAFNQEKLLWLNQQYIINAQPESLVEPLKYQFANIGIDMSDGPKIKSLIIAQQARAKTLLEMAQISRFFYQDINYNAKIVDKHLAQNSVIILQNLQNNLSTLDHWQAPQIKQWIKQVVDKLEIGFGKVAQPLRVAVTGGTSSPSIDITLELLGKKKTLDRIDLAIDYVKNTQIS